MSTMKQYVSAMVAIEEKVNWVIRITHIMNMYLYLMLFKDRQLHHLKRGKPGHAQAPFLSLFQSE